MSAKEDYLKQYDEFWKDMVENQDGTLNKDQVARELYDYGFLMENASTVYSEITGGLLSKPNYYASSVLGIYEDRMKKEFTENYLLVDAIELIIDDEELKREIYDSLGIDEDEFKNQY